MNSIHRGAKILIPISNFIDREKVAKALHAVSTPETHSIVLLHIIEVPSLTSPIDASHFKEEVDKAAEKLERVAEWIRRQGYKAQVKVLVARDVAEGIVEESNIGGYQIILMMKRKVRGGLSKLLHRSVSEKVIRSTKAMVLTFLVEHARKLQI
ncbi:MAG: universal stress protein [Candidatus Bathyarchaeia archaeon]